MIVILRLLGMLLIQSAKSMHLAVLLFIAVSAGTGRWMARA